MHITLTELIPGSYKVSIDQFDIKAMDAYYEDRPMLWILASEIAAALGAELVRINTWSAVSNAVIDDGVVDTGPEEVYALSPSGVQPSSVFSWHGDGAAGYIDMLVLVYFVDSPLTEETGGRIGFQYCADEDISTYCDIHDGDVYLQLQTSWEYKHRAERIVDLEIPKRRVVSIKLRGCFTPSEHCTLIR
jgi:hypothetical protein